jgi:hypothetical protein
MAIKVKVPPKVVGRCESCEVRESRKASDSYILYLNNQKNRPLPLCSLSPCVLFSSDAFMHLGLTDQIVNKSIREGNLSWIVQTGTQST